MEQVTGKEGKGVTGSGFTGPTKSNSYSQLPASSNASLGIDADTAAGYSDAATTPNTEGLNVGNDNDSEGTDDMSNAKFGIGADISTGTIRATEGVIAQRKPGEFGVSAKSGGAKMLSPDEAYGSGARRAGTAAQFGEPGRGGSMALAARGLSGNTSGASGQNSQPAQGAEKSKAKAQAGLKGSNSTD